MRCCASHKRPISRLLSRPRWCCSTATPSVLSVCPPECVSVPRVHCCTGTAALLTLPGCRCAPQEIARYLTVVDYALLFNYRGVGRSTGHTTRWGIVLDATAAVQFLRDEMSVPVSRIVLVRLLPTRANLHADSRRCRYRWGIHWVAGLRRKWHPSSQASPFAGSARFRPSRTSRRSS